MQILIADSGSTGVDWRLIGEGTPVAVSTQGINPVFMDRDVMVRVLHEELLLKLGERPAVSQVRFYGAGIVSDEVSGKVCDALREVFPDAACEAASDLLAAARALCGDKPGIACILGTGSNSCFYDGRQIVSNVRAGGFILGDEASGAWFGRQLLSDFIKGLLPQNLTEELNATIETATALFGDGSGKEAAQLLTAINAARDAVNNAEDAQAQAIVALEKAIDIYRNRQAYDELLAGRLEQ